MLDHYVEKADRIVYSKKVINRILGTVVGFLTSGIGFILFYLWVSNPFTATPLRVILSLVMIPLGIFFLIKAGRHEKKITFNETSKKKEKTLLEKNNERISEYEKTAELRDKLRVLKHL